MANGMRGVSILLLEDPNRSGPPTSFNEGTKMYIAIFKGSGKRIKRGQWGRPIIIYGQKFFKNRRVLLNEEFVQEAGLGNIETDQAILLSLKTDYGLYIHHKGEYSSETPKPRFELPDFSSSDTPIVEAATEEKSE